MKPAQGIPPRQHVPNRLAALADPPDTMPVRRTRHRCPAPCAGHAAAGSSPGRRVGSSAHEHATRHGRREEAGVGMLQRFENRLEQVVSGAFAKAFRSAVQPVEVAAALQREIDNSAQILSRNRRLVPNQFHVELSPQDYDRLAPYSSALDDELTDMLREHAKEQSYVFTGPISIGFQRREDLSTGRFRVRSAALAKATPVSDGSITDTAVRRAQVILEVNGMKHPLDPPGIIVGRGTDADLRINDPGVSRRHAEIRVHANDRTGTQVSVVDLGSTNGMLVNGSKAQQATLDDGATIKIGNTTMTVRFLPQSGAGNTRGDGGV